MGGAVDARIKEKGKARASPGAALREEIYTTARGNWLYFRTFALPHPLAYHEPMVSTPERVELDVQNADDNDLRRPWTTVIARSAASRGVPLQAILNFYQ